MLTIAYTFAEKFDSKWSETTFSTSVDDNFRLEITDDIIFLRTLDEVGVDGGVKFCVFFLSNRSWVMSAVHFVMEEQLQPTELMTKGRNAVWHFV